MLHAILVAHSPRIRAIPHTLPGHPQAHDQASPRLLARMNPQEALVKAGKATGSWLLTWAALPPLSMLRRAIVAREREKRVAWVLLAYAIGVLSGEEMRNTV